VLLAASLPAKDLLVEVDKAFVLETSTAMTPYRGYFGVRVNAFSAGGISTRVFLSLNDAFMIGINETIDGVVGSDKVQFHIPGVDLRVRIYGHAEKPSIALGYGYMTSYQRGRKNNQVIHGAYGVFTFPFKLLGFQKEVSVGFHFPLLPKAAISARYISYFSSINFPFNQYFAVKAEIKNMFLELNRRDEILLTVGLDFRLSRNLSAGFALDYASRDRIYYRVIALSYRGVFY